MKTKNLIGLDSENAQQVVNLLNELLANYQIYYQNLRGFHWNVRGNRFFVLHAKFEELYNDAIEKVDEIAERILTLGGVPLHSYAAYTKVATLKAKENVTDGDACLRAVVEDVQVLLKQEREILSVAAEIGRWDSGCVFFLCFKSGKAVVDARCLSESEMSKVKGIK